MDAAGSLGFVRHSASDGTASRMVQQTKSYLGSLLTPGVFCGCPLMINSKPPFVVFPLAGLCSGLCSGLSVILPPFGIIAPGLLFGGAIAHSFHTSITRLSLHQRTTLVVASTGGYFGAIVASLLSVRLPGFDNGLLCSSFAGAIAGGVGSVVVATSLSVMIPILSPPRTLLIVTVAGTFFGAVFMSCSVYISDYTTFGHPFDDILSFPLWQTGVASVIPFCKRCTIPE